jgi:hypothetical protein
MVEKSHLAQSPPLRSRDTRDSNVVVDLSVTNLPAPVLNIVVELVHRDYHDLLNGLNLDAPSTAIQRTLPLGRFDAILTVLGHDSDLLIRPQEIGFTVTHFNDRFTANAQGAIYTFEAYQ